MPFFNDLDGSSESNVGSDDETTLAVPAKITSSKDISTLHIRNKSWSSADINRAVTGADPMAAIGNLVAGYWVRDQQRLLIASLTGVLADNDANDSDDMFYSVATDSADAITDAERISADVVIAGQATMGDQQESLAAIAMHSVPYAHLKKLALIDFIPDPINPQAAQIPTYLGMRVIVDDLCPAVAGSNRITYTSYLFAPGACAWGVGAPRVPFAVEREEAQGNGEGIETLHSRNHFILHPRGIAWQDSSVAGESPTNAELALAANWDRVYDRKLVRFAAIKTNG
jgi:hypothetical protein